MDERAALYMCGPPEAVMEDAYTDGPTHYSTDLDMQEGYVMVGKTLSGAVVFREQLVDGVMRTWEGA